MDVFPTNDLVWIVFYEPGARPRPLVMLAGQDAQALRDDVPQLAAILDSLKVRQRQLQIYSRHAEVLLLHLAEEPAASVAWHYRIAQQLVVDLWDTATATPLRAQTIALKPHGWLQRLLKSGQKLPPVARKLRACSAALFAARFPASGEPPAALDHARWLDAFGRYSKSCAIIEQHLQEKPDDGPGHFHLGMMLNLKLGQAQKSIPHLRRATELAKDVVQVWNGLGIALTSLGEEVQACAAFKQAATLADTFEEWINLAMAYLDNGLTGSARDAATRAQSHDPQEAMPFFVLSVCAMREKNQTEAARMLAQAEKTLRRMPPELVSRLAESKWIAEARGQKLVTA